MTHKKHFRRAQFGLATDGKKDCHHLLWSRHDWQNGYASELRSHPYFGIRIPQDSLHRQIHLEISNIPVPGGEACHKALEALNLAVEQKQVAISQDSPQERINFLLEIWDGVASTRRTVAALIEELMVFQAYEEACNTRLVAVPSASVPALLVYHPYRPIQSTL